MKRALLCLAILGLSCDRPTTRPAPVASEPAPAANDLATTMRRAHFAFRPAREMPSPCPLACARGSVESRGSEYAAHDATYEVRASGTSLTVRPSLPSRRAKSIGRPFTFTTTVTRDGVRVDNGAAAMTVETDGALRVVRGAVVERVRNDERGVEESWSFATAPRGDGDVFVQLAFDGGSASTTASGVHLVDTATALGLRVAHGTWIDARGVRVPVPAELDGDRIVLRVPAAVVSSSSFPAVLDPVISPELGIDTPVTGIAPLTQESAKIACGTASCLAVWSDWRRGELGDVFGARIDATGAVLDPFGVPIAATNEHEDSPNIAWNGAHYVVAWTAGEIDAGPWPEVRVARLDATAKVLDTTPAKLLITHYVTPQVACTSAQCVVGAIDTTGAVRYARVDSALTVLDSTPKTAATGATFLDASLGLAQLAGTWMFAWRDDAARIRTMRVNAAGALLDTTPGIPIGSTPLQDKPALAAGPSGYYLVWEDDRLGAHELYGARLDSTGGTLDASGIPIRKVTDYEVAPAVTFDGTNFVVGWTEGPPRTVSYDVKVARVSQMGKLVDTMPLALSSTTDSRQLALAALGGTTLAVFTDSVTATNQAQDIYLQRIEAGRVVGSRTIVSRSANVQDGPAVAYGAGQWLVAWTDYRGTANDTSDVYAARLDATGKVLDPTGIAIANVASASERSPVVAFDGTNWLVAYADSRNSTATGMDIYGTRIAATGTMLDPTGTPLYRGPESDGRPALIFDGVNYVLALDAGASLGGTVVLRVNKNAVPIDTGTMVLTGQHYDPALAFDGTNYLVVATSGGTGNDIKGVRVAPGMTALGAPFTIAAAMFMQHQPRVAFGSGQYLVTWTDERNGVDGDIYATRIKPDGTMLDTAPIVVAGGVGDQLASDVVHDGGDFFVVWEDRAGASSDVKGAFVAPSGALRPPAPLAIANLADHEFEPRVAAASKTQRMVVYSRFDLDPAFRSVRARARLVDGLPTGSACTTGAECISTACADGYCCDSACTDQCGACDVPGKEGLCVAITGAPKGTRPACVTGTPTTCTSRCDGVDKTMCTFPSTTTTCSTSACVAGVETHASTCNGAGACSDVPKSCGAYACGSTACNTTCTSAAECAAGFGCKDGTCIPALTLGEACTATAACTGGLFCTDGVCCGVVACAAGESCAAGKGKCLKLNGALCSAAVDCASGLCVDGVCCESACPGQCEACDVEGNKGKCVPVSGAPHGTRKACEVATAKCGARTCDGVSDVTQCVGYAEGTSVECGPSRCEGEKFFPTAFCTGAGACAEQKETSCVPYTCEAAGCRKTCSAPEHCAAGFVCKSGACEPIGTKCSDDQTSVVSSDGTTTKCAPYVCRAGSCIGRCESGADCTGETICDANGACVPRPARVDVEDGGGCSYGASSPSAWALAVAISMALGSRRARSRRASRR